MLSPQGRAASPARPVTANRPDHCKVHDANLRRQVVFVDSNQNSSLFREIRSDACLKIIVSGDGLIFAFGALDHRVFVSLAEKCD